MPYAVTPPPTVASLRKCKLFSVEAKGLVFQNHFIADGVIHDRIWRLLHTRVLLNNFLSRIKTLTPVLIHSKHSGFHDQLRSMAS